MSASPLDADLEGALERAFDRVGIPVRRRGRVREAIGTLVFASGIDTAVGEVCDLIAPDGSSVRAEVVGVRKDGVLLTPFGPMAGVSTATEVVPCGGRHRIAVGEFLLGRIVDGFGVPIDGRAAFPAGARELDVDAAPPHPLSRLPIDAVFTTGVRVLDALTTVGQGQRIGLFAPAGVGKSTLLGMLARGAQADVNVIALVGERGREVREFVDHVLGAQGLSRSVLVVATSDRSAMERARAALVATSIAEYFRAAGRNVLLMVDSITRYARAQREIGLAAGEPPTRRGFPPSIFAALPRLLERAGNDAHGRMTAIYTVLLEGEDVDDPIGEEVRSILDGHIVLSRQMAERNIYPAVDPLASLSRVMSMVAAPAHRDAAGRLRSLLAKLREVEPLLQMGEYQPGADKLADEALRKKDHFGKFLGQRTDERTDWAEMLRGLSHVATG
jgi:type III secretion protein N (ATPase)